MMRDKKIVEEMARLDGLKVGSGEGEYCWFNFPFDDKYPVFGIKPYTKIHKSKLPDGTVFQVSEPRCEVVGPDYLEDHNAVQRVLLTLLDNQLDRYMWELESIVTGDHRTDEWAIKAMLKSDAKQKCEAILKAMGKWED